MSDDPSTERILDLLRPFAANWSGTLKRGDLVIPKEELTKVAEQLVALAVELNLDESEVSDLEIFQVLQKAQRLASVQDQVEQLRQSFRIFKKIG